MGSNQRSKCATLEEYFDKRLIIEANGCWSWTGGHCPDGYSITFFRNKRRFAHRASYERFMGPIPAGLTIDHLCRNRGCVNPAHLEPVTADENKRRGQRARHAARVITGEATPEQIADMLRFFQRGTG